MHVGFHNSDQMDGKWQVIAYHMTCDTSHLLSAAKEGT